MKKNINRGRTAKDQGSFRGGVGRVGTPRRGSWTPGLWIGIRDFRPGLAPSLLSDDSPTSGLLIPSFFPSRRQKTPDPVRPNASRDDQIKRSCLPDPSWPTPSRLQTRREGLCCMPPVDLADAGGCSYLRLRPPRAAFLHSFVMRQTKPESIFDLVKTLATLDRTRQPPEAQAPAAQKYLRHLLPSRRSDPLPHPPRPQEKEHRDGAGGCPARPQRLLGHPPCNQPKHTSPVAECCLTTLVPARGTFGMLMQRSLFTD